MSQCSHVQSMLSAYNDGDLSTKDKRAVSEHLESCQDCSKEDDVLRGTVRLLNHMPMPEPRIDLWSEFEPKMLNIESELRLTPLERIQREWHRFVGHLAEGMVLYTHIVAQQTLAKMERYLIRDPFDLRD